MDTLCFRYRLYGTQYEYYAFSIIVALEVKGFEAA